MKGARPVCMSVTGIGYAFEVHNTQAIHSKD